MNNPESTNSQNKNLTFLIANNWESLDEGQKKVLLKIWKVITYKWQLQILFNLSFLIWWLLDVSFTKVHTFDLQLIFLVVILGKNFTIVI